MKLNETEIESRLAACEGWEREDDRWIIKKYQLPTFLKGITFVNEVAEAAEQLNHHPFISIDYKIVTLRITNWHIGGLTELDFKAAAAFDQAFARGQLPAE